MRILILPLLLISLNAWSQDGELERLNRVLINLEGFSFLGDGKAVLEYKLWDKKTTGKYGNHSIIYTKVGRDPTPDGSENFSKNNLVQIDYRDGKVSQISQNSNSFYYTTAQIDNDKIKSLTLCQPNSCITVEENFCKKLTKTFGVKNLREIDVKVNECSRLNSTLSNVAALTLKDEVVDAELVNMARFNSLNDERATFFTKGYSNNTIKDNALKDTNLSLSTLYGFINYCEIILPNGLEETTVKPTPKNNKGTAQ